MSIFLEKFKKLENKHIDKFDIIYSITIHESFECVLDLILNIYYFNQNIKFGIIFNCNELMFNKLQNIQIHYDWLFINPIYFEKQKYGYDILKAHLVNFKYLCDNKIIFDNLILMASNCVLVKDINLLDINKIAHTSINQNNLIINNDIPDLNNNLLLKDFYNKNNIQVKKNYHEGKLYKFDEFEKIYNYIQTNNFESMITGTLIAEETILNSVSRYVLNKEIPQLCEVDSLLNERKLKSVKLNKNIFMFKKVPRIIDHFSRKVIQKEYLDKI